MKTYETISEAVKDLKSKTGHGHVRYFVNGEEVKASQYRTADGDESIYRSGLEIFAEKTRKNESSTVYTVNITDRTSSNAIFESANEAEAREFFENQKQQLSANTPADVTGWQDRDQAWASVYCVELTKNVLDEVGDIEEVEAIESTEYYYR
ncbi:MAG: hypothetical protein NC209_03980 [Alistipes sp.]|nr:hypothetical protein [Lachnospiraceae bacterium]MCM1250290.1 hypothetical protein [Alistipes sp.]